MNILDHAKEVADLVKKYNDLDLYQKIVDLRDEIFALREENLSLRTRIKELEQTEDVSSKLKREGNVYFLTTTEGKKEGPFCMTCWDADRKLVNLLLDHDYRGETIKCNRCMRRGK